MSLVEQEIRQERVPRRLSQQAIGRMAGLSHQEISKAERGERSIPPESALMIAEQMNAPRICLRLVEETTRGIFGSPVLDGEMVDLHRSSVKGKLLEELHEAIEALQQIDLTNKPNLENTKEIERIWYANEQLIDARVAIDNYLVVIFESYNLSFKEAFEEHHLKLIMKGYQRSKTKRKTAFAEAARWGKND